MSLRWAPLLAKISKDVSLFERRPPPEKVHLILPRHGRGVSKLYPLVGTHLKYLANEIQIGRIRANLPLRLISLSKEVKQLVDGQFIFGHVTVLNPHKVYPEVVHLQDKKLYYAPADFHVTIYHDGLPSLVGPKSFRMRDHVVLFTFVRGCYEHFNIYRQMHPTEASMESMPVFGDRECLVHRNRPSITQLMRDGAASQLKIYVKQLVTQFLGYMHAIESLGPNPDPRENARREFLVEKVCATITSGT